MKTAPTKQRIEMLMVDLRRYRRNNLAEVKRSNEYWYRNEYSAGFAEACKVALESLKEIKKAIK